MEVKIILILLIIHLLGIIILKPKLNVLSCGIFAWAGKNVKTFNKAKFDIQGLYNDSRGGDSCGVTTDGEIYYGITGSKHYYDFLYKKGYEAPISIPTVIGHTRKSSSGIVNSENAHPFGFGGNKEKFEFIGVHNGTLYNQDDLAKTYNLETTVKEVNNFGVNAWKRNKIDSEILLEIIYKNKNFKVLSDYNGGAALLFTNTLEPNILYVFKGASKADNYDRNLASEERPLYYYSESKNSLYISSLQESLEAIGGIANENLFSFTPNNVYKITDGNIINCEKIEISRSLSFQKPVIKTKAYQACGYKWEGEYYDMEDLREKGKKEKGEEEIQNEIDVRIFKSPITFNKLRYNRNGHLINGIYVWIEEYGFVSIGLSVVEADKKLEEYINKAFDLEYGYFQHGKEVDKDDEDIIYPFTTENKKTPGLFYFHEGIMIETRTDYLAITSKLKDFNLWDLSEMSRHPITDINQANYKAIIYKRTSFTGNICPLGSSKIYYIEAGYLTSYKLVEKDEIKDKAISDLLKQNQLCLSLYKEKAIKQDSDDKLYSKMFSEFCNKNEMQETSNKESEDKKIEINNEEISSVKKSVDTLMSPIYLQIQESIDALNEFKDQQFVQEIIETNEDYLMSLDEIIDKTYK